MNEQIKESIERCDRLEDAVRDLLQAGRLRIRVGARSYANREALKDALRSALARGVQLGRDWEREDARTTFELLRATHRHHAIVLDTLLRRVGLESTRSEMEALEAKLVEAEGRMRDLEAQHEQDRATIQEHRDTGWERHERA